MCFDKTGTLTKKRLEMYGFAMGESLTKIYRDFSIKSENSN